MSRNVGPADVSGWPTMSPVASEIARTPGMIQSSQSSSVAELLLCGVDSTLNSQSGGRAVRAEGLRLIRLAHGIHSGQAKLATCVDL